MTLSYSEFSVISIRAIQEQQQIIEKQQSEFDELKKAVEELQNILKAGNETMDQGTPDVEFKDGELYYNKFFHNK